MLLELVPIYESLEENEAFLKNPLYKDTVLICIAFYKKIGFMPPWICYYVSQEGHLVGSAAFKGQPVNGTVEIAYGTMEEYRKQGIATAICKLLVDLAQKTDSTIRITARALPENSFSTQVLIKNNFKFTGMVNDPDDGNVCEWLFIPA